MGSDFSLLLMDKKEGVTSFSSLYPVPNTGEKGERNIVVIDTWRKA